MSSERQDRDERGRVEELLRMNAELAAEVRMLSLDRGEGPAPGKLPAARRLARIEGERNALQAEREALQARLGSLQGQLRAVEGERDGLLRHRDELLLEVTRLRSGFRGILRRARARILRSHGEADTR